MKIIAGNRISLIIKREDGAEYDAIVKVQSSTVLQPYYGINFINGKAVGGSTMSQSQVETVVAAAKKANLKIEE
jgi:hypothetical protein